MSTVPSELASAKRDARGDEAVEAPARGSTAVDSDEDSDNEREESFFALLQKERRQWDKEHSKLMSVIELQQRLRRAFPSPTSEREREPRRELT